MTASTTTIAPTGIVPIRFCHSLMSAPPHNYTLPPVPTRHRASLAQGSRQAYEPGGRHENRQYSATCYHARNRDISGIGAEGGISMTPKRAVCETGLSQKSM